MTQLMYIASSVSTFIICIFTHTHVSGVSRICERGCPKNDAHAHNVGGRGPTHVKFDRTQNRPTSTTTGQFCAVRVASARAYPCVLLAFVGFLLASYRLELSGDPRVSQIRQ